MSDWDLSEMDEEEEGEEEDSTPRPPLIVIKPRPPQATNTALSSLAWLGNETMLMVVGLLHDTCPRSVSSLALVSSHYHHLARYTQHREVVLDNTTRRKSNHSLDKLEFIEKSGIAAAVRRLEVRNGGSDAFESKLCRLLPKMTGLTDLTWLATGVPLPVLEILKGRPSVRLHTMFFRLSPSDDNAVDVIERLEGNENLVSLRAIINYVRAAQCVRFIKPVKRVILSCPNLRKLELDVSLPRSGCVVYGLPAEYCGFGFVDGERPPALEELELGDYPFGSRAPDYPSINSYISFNQGYPLEETEKDYWANVFDWSRLKRLATYDIHFALKIVHQLTSLKEFCCIWDHGPVKTFYQQVPSSLETIYVARCETIGLENLLRHGSSLKKLTIHKQEDYGGGWQQGTVDAKTLAKIRDGCPHIEEMTLDIPRKKNWPYEVLDILATFPRLRNLKIWFELGIGDKDNLVKPYVRFSEIEGFFNRLRASAPRGTVGIRKLEVASGSPPDVGHGLLSSHAFWPQHNSTNFVCVPADREDEAARGICVVRCTLLNERQNEFLRKARPGVKYRNYPFSGHDEERFLVARDGPKSWSEWKPHY
ncbi:hypothetical protein GGS23DRAFT_598096 [Durotheca rogersii]|uniref:uncharacterized protein n=1 Tax=Durotheca rogersii TaxID=419775 RepID=UPI0022207A2A|nr:uncharacterized protein GGS23DRAFT_598096 [Durotheca rogersii]KAI5861682.1 hypothetical protein GGS23DRAFT_598096 [Durotheca rogersii]